MAVRFVGGYGGPKRDLVVNTKGPIPNRDADLMHLGVAPRQGVRGQRIANVGRARIPGKRS